MYMYTTAYGPADNKSELIGASPISPTEYNAANAEESGPFAAPQTAIAVSPPLHLGVPFTETWAIGQTSNAHPAVETTVIALVLYP